MHLTRQEFHRLARQAVEELPSEVSRALENVAILVEDWPSDDDLKAAGIEDRHHLFGLYTGVPLLERGNWQPPLPDTITLFQRPIETGCGSHEQLIGEIRVTLLHEVGHYLGMSEEDLERRGYG